MKQQIDPRISAMKGSESLPRNNGELVFHDEWEKRAFALAVALCEQGRFSWNDFREELVISIANDSETVQNSESGVMGYYEHWLIALEETLDKRGIAPSDQTPG